MANLDRVVNVQISLNTTGISTEGFSTLLIVGAHVHSLARVETYTRADDMISAGFSDTDPLYLAAVDAFSQTPRPRQVKIGRRLVSAVGITPSNVTTTGVYTVKISTMGDNGEVTTTPYSYTNSGGTAAAIATGIQNLIANDDDAVVTATAADGVLTVTDSSGDSFMVEVTSNLTQTVKTVTETIAQTMAAITAYDNDWYGWALASRASADISEFSGYESLAVDDGSEGVYEKGYYEELPDDRDDDLYYDGEYREEYDADYKYDNEYEDEDQDEDDDGGQIILKIGKDGKLKAVRKVHKGRIKKMDQDDIL